MSSGPELRWALQSTRTERQDLLDLLLGRLLIDGTTGGAAERGRGSEMVIRRRRSWLF